MCRSNERETLFSDHHCAWNMLQSQMQQEYLYNFQLFYGKVQVDVEK